MRKQYHFRKVGEDTDIWDVHHLVELTKTFLVKEICLNQIQELKEAYWFPDNVPTTQQTKILVVQFAQTPEPDFINIDENDLNYEA